MFVAGRLLCDHAAREGEGAQHGGRVAHLADQLPKRLHVLRANLLVKRNLDQLREKKHTPYQQILITEQNLNLKRNVDKL